MSLMCKMGDSCGTMKGMCIHEKMMMALVVVGGAAALAHWGFHLF